MVVFLARVFSGLRLPGWTTAPQPCTVPGQAGPEELLGGSAVSSAEVGQCARKPCHGVLAVGNAEYCPGAARRSPACQKTWVSI